MNSNNSNYYVRKKGGRYNVSYSGELLDALEKAKNDLEREQKNPELWHWEWMKKKATTAVKMHKEKINKLKIFISVAEKELEKQKEGAECTET